MTILRLAILVAFALVVAQLNAWEPLDQVIAAGVTLLVAAYLWSRQSLRGIAVSRRLPPDRAQVGQTVSDEITVRNKSWLGKLWLEVRDQSSLPRHEASRVLNLGGRRSNAWTTQTVCTRRGRFQFGPILLRSGDPFGFFPATRRLGTTLDLLVYPAVVDLPAFALPAATLMGGPTTNRRTPTVTPMVTGVRDYVQGDAYNRISWTSTARLGRLMVKEFDVDPTSDVWIVLDLERPHHAWADEADRERAFPASSQAVERWLDSTEEYAVAIAASIARSCLDQGRGVGLIATGAHYEIVQAERSDRTYVKVLEALAVVMADGHRPLAEVLVMEARRFDRNTAAIVITPSVDAAWADALAAINANGARASVVWLDPSTFDHRSLDSRPVDRVAGARVSTYRVGYGEAIAMALRGSSL